MVNTAHGEKGGAKFAKGVPDEHETIGIVERFFQSGQRRGATCNMGFIDPKNTTYKYFGLDAMSYGILTLNHTPRAKFGYAETSYSIVFKSLLDLAQTCLLPFGFPVIAHSKKLVDKLHGRGTECIYLRLSEGGLFLSGIFFNVATRKTITCRSFSSSNDVPFDLFIAKDGKRQFEVEDEICDDLDLNEPPNESIEELHAGSTSDSEDQVPDLVLDNEDMVPDLVLDSDYDYEKIEMDSERHSWAEVSLSSLSTIQKRKFGNLVGKFFIERNKSDDGVS